MGIKRVVDVGFWEDDKVESMTPEERYFWIYLLTSPHTKQLGIYRITKRQMAFHLGYDVETVSKLLDRFENTHGLIKFVDNEIAIKNYLKHSILKGGKPVEDCLMADIKDVKHKSLIKWVFGNINVSETNNTVQRVIEAWQKESTKERIYENDIHNDIHNDNDSIVGYDTSTIRPRIVVVALPLNLEGTFHYVYEEDVEHYKELYPAVDIEQELRKMVGWCEANPKKRKTSNGISNFINTWLSKAQDKCGRVPNELDETSLKAKQAYIKDVEMREEAKKKKEEGVWFE